MEYTPRHAQPFTLEQAVHLDVAIINEEIARLQNSLQHLNETQSLLRTHLASETDPDLKQALEENEEVIASQTERISILRMALTQKGIPAMSAHYDLPPSSGSTATAQDTTQVPSAPVPATNIANGISSSSETSDDDENGLHL
ncbi:hypothetical protein HDZ31DRAFT_31275 [Schizophyllum fasciatum]